MHLPLPHVVGPILVVKMEVIGLLRGKVGNHGHILVRPIIGLNKV